MRIVGYFGLGDTHLGVPSVWWQDQACNRPVKCEGVSNKTQKEAGYDVRYEEGGILIP